MPRLPRPRELKPYPNQLCLQFLGHKKAVHSISISPDGQYLASASADQCVRLWEMDTALCVRVWKFAKPVVSVQFNPNPSYHLLAAVVNESVVFIATGTGEEDATELTEGLLQQAEEFARSQDGADEEIRWTLFSEDEENANGTNEDAAVKRYREEWMGAKVGPRVSLVFKDALSSAQWHYKGDYIVTLRPEAGAAAICIHQLSKGKTQKPFSKGVGRVQAVCFHPSRPFLFVATQQHVKVYNLVEQKMVKKLLSGCKWLSSMNVHSSGDHVIVGSYDRRVVWFDLDLSSSPYKTLKFHDKAVRAVTTHKRYPLMASASDDGTVQIFHSTVYRFYFSPLK